MILKICGMREPRDIELASQLGFNMCGFIFHNKSPRYIDPEIVANLPTGKMARVGVFVDGTASEINRVMSLARLDFAQLHGNQDAACARRLGAGRVIRVLWPERLASTAELNRLIAAFADSCAMFLLDAGLRGGGSGRRLDPLPLADLRFPKPWFLAGGLSPENLAGILAVVSSDGLDFNSGLEIAPGIKDHEKMRLAAQIAASWQTKGIKENNNKEKLR